jgi:hypothetical protein
MADDSAGRYASTRLSVQAVTLTFHQEDALCISGRLKTQGDLEFPTNATLGSPFHQFAELSSSSTTSLSSYSSLPAYGLQGSFSPIIADLMHTYNTTPPTDELSRAQTELNQVKDIMVQNVEQILSRGERIELLLPKTDNLANQATLFRRGARSVRRQMWWRNTKILALFVLVGLVSALRDLV